jgi:hypothetical protein
MFEGIASDVFGVLAARIQQASSDELENSGRSFVDCLAFAAFNNSELFQQLLIILHVSGFYSVEPELIRAVLQRGFLKTARRAPKLDRIERMK